jgi:hypothetical protein
MKDTLTHDYLQYPIPAFNSSIAVSALPVPCLLCLCHVHASVETLSHVSCCPHVRLANPVDGPGADDAGLTCVALTVSGDPWSEVQRKRAVSRGGTKVCDSWPASLAC